MAGGKRQRSKSSSKNSSGNSKHEDNQQRYYDRILHMCRKDLNKQAKVTKNFECQKLIRKLKEVTVTTATTATAASANTSSTAKDTLKKEEHLKELKDMPMEPVMDECFRRLGILTLNPNPTTVDKVVVKAMDTDNGNSDTTTVNAGSTMQHWIERILQHKRMRECLEKWSDEVTEYRRWCIQNEQQHENRASESKRRKSSKEAAAAASGAVAHKRQALQQEQESSELQAEALSSSLFVRLGDAADYEENDDADAHDMDPDADAVVGGAKVKKNRPGQRARKAKVLVKELRQQGKPVPEDLHWRPKVDRRNVNWRENEADGNGNDVGCGGGGGGDGGSTAAPASNTSQETKDLHPSWEARKKQESGIVAFQGKKITFD